MKTHIGVDADSGLVHSSTATDINDVTQGHGLLHDEEMAVSANAGYHGATKRLEATSVDWYLAIRPGKCRAADKQTKRGALLDKTEYLFRVIKCRPDFLKPRCKRAGQKHGAVTHAVCFEYSVDVAPTTEETAGMNALEMWPGSYQ